MNVKITYLAHSGFLVELDTCYLLFDYYKGNIDNLDKGKKLIVFVSHSHYDHFNKDVFYMDEKYPDIKYYISSDIKLSYKDIEKYGIGELSRKIEVVKPSQVYSFEDKEGNEITVKTLKSTDRGVAYIVSYLGNNIYHAGDLHLWVWKEEDKQFNNNMTARFNKEMDIIKNYSIDVAFAPLDPRQEDWYHLGMDALLNTTEFKYVFPMHFWDQPNIIKKYKEHNEGKFVGTKIMDVERTGQTWTIDI